ncbi:MAG: crAss001_48 related protein [Clostridium sp.]
MLTELRELRVKLIEEQRDLSLKVEKLNVFLYSKDFDSLNREMKDLLIEQYSYMKQYLRVMNKRIALVNEQIKDLKK